MPPPQAVPAILGADGRPYRRDPAPAPARRSSFDAARTTVENAKHWANAGEHSPRAQLTPGVRKVLRERSRYECQNNSYASGAVRTLVNDTVGKGPRLQMLTADPGLNLAVEDLWREWAAASDWALDVRVLCGVKHVAGECFGIPFDSRRLDRMGLPVTLKVRLIEPDQVAHPWSEFPVAGSDDGVDCDDQGEVVSYRVLRAHPGDPFYAWGVSTQADTYRAEDVLHWFEPTRPGQLRGVTPFAPALGVFAQLRRFTSATLTAAEVAAMLAGVMTQAPDLGAGAEYAPTPGFDSMDTVELVRGMLLTLPPGATATQFKPEQPTTNYDTFVNAKLRECGRCLNMPFGKLAGDHSSYNYSSGRLDDAPYWADRDIERQALEAKIFNPFFYLWCDFARFALPGLAAYKGRWWQLRHAWQYDARPTSDPVKDATGDELNLTNGTDSLADIAAREGLTEDELLDKRAATMAKFQARGLPLPPWLAGTPSVSRVGDGQPQAPEAARG